MGFSRKLNYFLVHRLHMTNKEAQALVKAGQVKINGQTVVENGLLDAWSEVAVAGRTVRPKLQPRYLLFHKPPGFQSSLHPALPDHIAGFLPPIPGLAIAGRLDKASRGLLLLSNHGAWVEHICHPNSGKEKEYLVELQRAPEADFFNRFENGVRLGAYTTQACRCSPVSERVIRVVLQEGKNRQIRRMCQQLGHTVTDLKRIRVGELLLGNLAEGEWQEWVADLTDSLP